MKHNRKKLPENVLPIYTFAEFKTKCEQWVDGKYSQYLALLGNPGLGKSEEMRRALTEKVGAQGRYWGYVKTAITGWNLYKFAYDYRTLPILLDDCDNFRPEAVSVLKALTDSAPVRRVGWHSDTKEIKNGEYPRSYKTNSPFVVISNSWERLSQNLNALYNRALVLLFAPGTVEVHREVGDCNWFKDKEVWDFVGKNLHLVTSPSFRFYNMGVSHKKAGGDWKSELLLTLTYDLAEGETLEGKKRLIAIAKLLSEKSEKKSVDECQQEFTAAGLGSRATFYRYQKILEEKRLLVDPGEMAKVRWNAEAKKPKPLSAYDIQMQKELKELDIARQEIINAGGVREEEELDDEEECDDDSEPERSVPRLHLKTNDEDAA